MQVLVPAVLLNVMASSVPVDEAVVRFYAVLFLLQKVGLFLLFVWKEVITTNSFECAVVVCLH